jgi:hypothetical protein
MNALPDLSRTEAAIAAYDAHDITYMAALAANTGRRSCTILDEWYKKSDLLAFKVGEAYGLDTKDRNNPKDCADLIRPGPATPSDGSELSFVRRMVALWKEQR